MDEASKQRSIVDKRLIYKVFRVFVYLFAVVGFVLVGGYFAVRFGFTNQRGLIDNQRQGFLYSHATSSPEWAVGEEWDVLKKAIINDTDTINKAAHDTDIPSRLLVSILIPEQLRLFHSERDLFKKVFSPLQILVNQNQFSWGIMGIKKETAVEIERNLKDHNSVFYPGEKYENLLDFSTEDTGTERFTRIIDEDSHYYGYLYAALYIKQIINQWNKAGYDISDNPAVIATLYNIGFSHSKPKDNPLSGGAEIDLGNRTKSFGSIAGEFYLSKELIDYFPRITSQYPYRSQKP